MISDKWYTVRIDFRDDEMKVFAQRAGEHPVLLMKELEIK